jgi:hypothetical protein
METVETLSYFVRDLLRTVNADPHTPTTNYKVLEAICDFASKVGEARRLVAYYGEYPGKLGFHSNHVA